MEREIDTVAGNDSRPAAPRKDQLKDLATALHIRASDIEPFTGLRYLSKLFKFMGVILVLLIVSEVATGLVTQGATAIPTLLNEVSRLLVFAGLLWGAGDLAILLIDVGHDVRACRILMSRLAHDSMPLVAGGADKSPEREVTPLVGSRPADLSGSDRPNSG